MGRRPGREALDVLDAAPDGPVAFSADLGRVDLLAAYRAGLAHSGIAVPGIMT